MLPTLVLGLQAHCIAIYVENVAIILEQGHVMASIGNATTALMHPARMMCHPVIARGTGLLVVISACGSLWMALTLPDHARGAAVMVAIFGASLVSSIAGFAFSAVAGAILFHLQYDHVRIVAIMITCSIANQTVMTWALRHDIDWRDLRRYFTGGALGLSIGVWILLHADRMLYTRVLGSFLLVYASYMLLRRAIVIRRQPVIADVAAGFLGGITGGAVGFPGAFVSIWCGMKGWDKARQRAVTQPFILVMQVAGLLAISLVQQSHIGGAGLNLRDLIFVPPSLLGTSLGLALYGRLTDVQFGRAVNLLLMVSGLSYVL